MAEKIGADTSWGKTKKLGWLSSYTRQVLLNRYLLRLLPGDPRVVKKLSQNSLMSALRLALELFAFEERDHVNVFAPYAPSNRPNRYFLRYKGSPKLDFSIITGSEPYPQLGLTLGGPIDGQNIIFETLGEAQRSNFDVLAHEISTVGRGVTLSSKKKGEDRSARLLSKPLWPTQQLESEQSDLIDQLTHRLSEGVATDFWARFYTGLINGSFDEIALAREIASIPSADWEKGFRHIAEEIAGIEAQMRTAVATPIEKTEAGFSLIAEPSLPLETMEFISERIGGALTAALEAGGNNGFDETCYEAIVLRQALNSQNPSAVAGLLYDASLSFSKSIGDLYPDDSGLIALRAAAFSGSEEICETDEIARKRCLRMAKLHANPNAEVVKPDDLAELTQEVVAEADAEVAAIIEGDAKAISKGGRVSRFVRARFANYSATIVNWIDKTKKGYGRAEWLVKTVRKLLDFFQDTPP